jgi:hypothetical protein
MKRRAANGHHLLLFFMNFYLLSSNSSINAFISWISFFWASMISSASLRARGSEIFALTGQNGNRMVRDHRFHHTPHSIFYTSF